MARARRVLRWLFRGVVVLLALVLLLVGGALIYLQTDAGRARVRRGLESALNDRLDGHIRIGALEGNLLGRAVLRDVVIVDRTGREAVRVGRLEARYGLLGLVQHEVRVEAITVSDVVVSARDDGEGKLNLATLVRPSPAEPPAPPGPPSAWRIIVDELHLQRAAFSLDDAHADIEVTFRKLGVAGGELRLDELHVETGESRLDVKGLALAVDGSRARAELALSLRAADVQRLLPGTPWHADLVASGTLTKEDRWQAHLEGTLAGAPWSLEGSAALEREAAEVAFRVARIDPAAVWAGAVSGQLSLEASAQVAGFSLAQARGDARLSLDGTAQGHRVDSLKVDASLAAGELHARLAERGPGESVDVDATVGLLARPLVVRAATVRGRVPRLAALVGKLAPIDGALDVDFEAHGPVDDLAATGRLDGSGLAYQTRRAARLQAAFAIHGLPGDPVGSLHLRADGVRQGDLVVGSVSADADFRDEGRRIGVSFAVGDARAPYALSARAQVERPRAGGAKVQVDRLEARVRGLVWKGRVGSLVVDGKGGLRVKDVELRSSAGSLVAAADFGTGKNRVSLELGDLHLDELRRTFAPTAPALPADARADARLALAGRDLTANVSVDGGDLGKLTLAAQARGPADPLDGRAWQRIDERALGKLHVELSGVSLARVSELAHLPAPLSGELRAELDAAPGLSALQAHVGLSGVKTPYVDRPLGVEATLDLRRGRLQADVRATREGGGAVQLVASALVPAQLTRIEPWRKLSLGALESARLTLEGVELAWSPPLRERVPGLEGKLDGTIEATPASETFLTADLTLAGARSAQLPTPVDAHLTASLDSRRLTAAVSSKLGGQPLIDADIALAAGSGALLAGRTEAFLAAPAVAHARMAGFPLELAQKTLALPVLMQGPLDLDGQLQGSLTQPVVDVRARLAQAKLHDVVFGRLEAEGHLDGKQLRARLVGEQLAGGSLDALVEVDRRDMRNGRAQIKASRFDLGFLSIWNSPTGLSFKKGVLDADLDIDQSGAGRVAKGSLKLTGGELRVNEALASFHEANVEVTVAPDNRITVKARAGVGAGGRLALDGAAHLAGLSLREAQGSFSVSDLSVATGRSKVGVDARGRFSGQPESGSYALRVALESTSLRLPKDVSGGELHPTGPLDDVVFIDEAGARGARAEKAAGTLALFEAPFLRLHLGSESPILVRSEELRADMNARLEVALYAGRSEIRGTVTIDSGFIELFGRRWDFQTSHLSFDGATPPNPRLDLKLMHEFRTDTVYVHLGGTAQKPLIALSSESGSYDRPRLLAFVLGGSPDEAGQSQGAELSQQALSAAGGFLFGQVQPLLKKLVPVDTVNVKQKKGTTEVGAVTVGKWLSGDIYVGYEHHFADESVEVENANEGRLEWYLLHSLRFDVVFGDRGEGSADFLWIQRW